MAESICDLLTIDEFCETLKIGYNAAYTLLNSGEVSAFRIGRNWKIPKSSIEEFIMRKLEENAARQDPIEFEEDKKSSKIAKGVC